MLRAIRDATPRGQRGGSAQGSGSDHCLPLLQSSYPIWEDFNSKATKLHSQLRWVVWMVPLAPCWQCPHIHGVTAALSSMSLSLQDHGAGCGRLPGCLPESG